MQFCQIIVAGYLAKDAEYKPFEERQVINFTVISNLREKKGQSNRSISWDCEFWVSRKFNLSLPKGTGVIVSGSVDKNEWTVEGEQYPRKKLVVVVNDVQIFTKKTNSGGNEESFYPPYSGNSNGNGKANIVEMNF
jgi:single-stranded DNA-binding protein